MGFQSQERVQPATKSPFQASAAPGAGKVGGGRWLPDASPGLFGAAGGLGGGLLATGAAAARPAAQTEKQLGGALKQAHGDSKHLAGALDAAASGASVAEQAQKIGGEVKVKASSALAVAGQLGAAMAGAGKGASTQPAAQPAAESGGYMSPFVSIALSGITNDQSQAEGISRTINGDATAHAYAAYGGNRNSYQQDLLQTPGTRSMPGIQSPGEKNGPIDPLGDVAAVTQYAAAADLGIRLETSRDGSQQVRVNWQALDQMEVSADFGMIGDKVRYDSPAQVAQNGYQAAMAEIASRRGDPNDRSQFISLVGHSGGGQSSFYTALKLASEGYQNVSLVGVDMAMTPHQRQVLEALGVNVTNITSHDQNGRGSEVGDVIRTGMGGGQNYYDLDVTRQANNGLPLAGATARHSATNDANVVTMVRYAQYLDAVGQHGNFSDPALYQQFLTGSNQTGNQLRDPNDPSRVNTADANLLSQYTDNRGRPGPEGNSTAPGGSASAIENGVNMLGGNRIPNAIRGTGQQIANTVDQAGDRAQGWLGSAFGRVGNFFGGLANSGIDLVGRGVQGVGSLIGNGLDRAGDLAQGAWNGVSGLASSVGNTANRALDFVGNGISSVGNAVGGGLDRAGDTAQSWLGHIPLVGGLLGSAVNRGMDFVGSGVSGAANLVGGGLDHVGDVAQGAGNLVASGARTIGQAQNQGLDFLGRGIQQTGNTIGNGIDRFGDKAASTIQGGFGYVGNALGGLANRGIDAVGQGIGSAFNWAGDRAGDMVNGTVSLLQGVGVDTSNIAGLSNFHGNDPNRTRQWQQLVNQTGSFDVVPNPQHTEPDPHSGPFMGAY